MRLDSLRVENLLFLTKALNQNDAWRNVTVYFGLNPEIHLGELSPDGLITALMRQGTTVEVLQQCLTDLGFFHALSYISQQEPLRIVREPYLVKTEDCHWRNGILYVRAGGELHLSIDAVGSPLPSFQWFHDNALVSETKELMIPNFSKGMQGFYRCSIQQLVDFGSDRRVSSEDVEVQIQVYKEVPQISDFYPKEKVELECGEEFRPYVKVVPGSEPTFQWYFGSKLLPYKTSNICIPKVSVSDTGKYECRVKNESGESFAEFKLEVNEKRVPPTEKKALIITNASYKLKLHTPHHDGTVLMNCLEKENFVCTHLKDLTAREMEREIKEFYGTLKKGGYVLFYYGGHGCLHKNSLYMMGCDANFDNLKDQHVLHESILEGVQEYEPLFFIIMLDMCQNQLKGCSLEAPQSNHQWNGNMIRCLTTSQNRKAYEMPTHTSLYMKHLQQHINNKDLSCFEVINRVNICVQADKKEQIPKIEVIGRTDFKLSDPAFPRDTLD